MIANVEIQIGGTYFILACYQVRESSVTYPPWIYTFTGNFFFLGKEGGMAMFKNKLQAQGGIESIMHACYIERQSATYGFSDGFPNPTLSSKGPPQKNFKRCSQTVDQMLPCA